MTGAGELIDLIFCSVFTLLGLAALVFILLSKNFAKRILFLFIFLVIVCIVLLTIHDDRIDYLKYRADHLGTYYLVSYPKCSTCVLVLKDDNTFEVKQQNRILEKGAWDLKFNYNFCMNNDGDQLGTGRFQYYDFKIGMQN